jgi:hypothetical protein
VTSAEEIAATRRCAAAALRILASTASEIASELEHGLPMPENALPDLEEDCTTARRALGELERLSR